MENIKKVEFTMQSQINFLIKSSVKTALNKIK